jgi:hypothetical protein
MVKRIFSGTWYLHSLTRRNPNNGQIQVEDNFATNGWKMSVATNANSEIQLGAYGYILTWTALCRFRLSISADGSRATFDLTDSDFVMVVTWNIEDDQSIMHRLITEPSGAILGILELTWIVPKVKVEGRAIKDDGRQGQAISSANRHPPQPPPSFSSSSFSSSSSSSSASSSSSSRGVTHSRVVAQQKENEFERELAHPSKDINRLVQSKQ